MTALLLRLAALLSLIVAACVIGVQYSSKSWPATQAEIARSGWARDVGLQGSKGVYTAHYDYTVNGKRYASERVSFADNVSLVHVIKSYQGDATDVLRSPHPGDIVRAYYAPWWPAVSVLMPGPAPAVWIWGVVAFLFSIMCLVLAKQSHHPLY